MAESIAAIVLAAGGSSRLGTPKQLVTYRGAPLVRRAAESARAAECARVYVVVGAHANAVVAALANVDVTLVPNAAWSSGLASSIVLGVRSALDHGAHAVLLTLADQPLVDAAALRRVLGAFPGPHGVVASEYGDVIGVPAAFAREQAQALLALAGDAGAGAWLRRHRDVVLTVPMPEAETDVDTPDDLNALPP